MLQQQRSFQQSHFSRALTRDVGLLQDYGQTMFNVSHPHHHDEGKTMFNSHGPYARKIRSNSRNVLGNREVAELVRETLEATYDGDASKHKAAARDANSSARAAENWFAADNPMSLTAFLNAYHNNTTFKAWARKILLMEQDHDPEFQAQLAAFIRAAQGVQP